jgi:hypothetical protein
MKVDSEVLIRTELLYGLIMVIRLIMKKLISINIITCLLLVWFAFLAARTLYVYVYNPLIYTVKVPIENSSLPTFGTFFQINNKDGLPIVGAGIPYVINTRSEHKNVIQIFIKKEDPKLRIVDLGVPFDNTSTIKLKSIDDNLYAVNTDTNELKKYNSRNWVSVGSEIFDSIDAGKKALWSYNFNNIYYKYYENGAERFFEVCKQGRGCKIHEIDYRLWFFTLIPDFEKESITVFGSRGEIIEIDYYSLIFHEKVKDYSDQFYSTIFYQSDVLLGHYPSGTIFKYDTKNKKPSFVDPKIGKEECSSANEREVQSMAFFGGDLIAGLWPFGELWVGRPYTPWHREARLFSGSSCGVAPYIDDLYDSEYVYNALGQRIVDMVPYADGLIVATGIKHSNPRVSDSINFLEKNLQSEYGRVYKLTKHVDLSCPIPLEDIDFVEFKFYLHRILLSVNEKIICELAYDFSETQWVNGIRAEGYGVFGPLLQ